MIVGANVIARIKSLIFMTHMEKKSKDSSPSLSLSLLLSFSNALRNDSNTQITQNG